MLDPSETVQLAVPDGCPPVTAKVKSWREQKVYLAELDEASKCDNDRDVTDATIEVLCRHVETIDGKEPTKEMFDDFKDWRWIFDIANALRFGLTVRDKKKSE